MLLKMLDRSSAFGRHQAFKIRKLKKKKTPLCDLKVTLEQGYHVYLSFGLEKELF